MSSTSVGSWVGSLFGTSSSGGSGSSSTPNTTTSGVQQSFGTGGVNIGTKSASTWTTPVIIGVAIVLAALVLKSRRRGG